MNPVDFPEANLTLTGPSGIQTDVQPLRVQRFTGDPARGQPPGYLSCWMPDEIERAAIAAGGPVWVIVWGSAPPPPISVEGCDRSTGAAS